MMSMSVCQMGQAEGMPLWFFPDGAGVYQAPNGYPVGLLIDLKHLLFGCGGFQPPRMDWCIFTICDEVECLVLHWEQPDRLD